MIIFGSGLVAMIAGALLPNAKIFAHEPLASHHAALLRFRSSRLFDMLRIPAQRVEVRKRIWWASKEYDRCSIQHGNLYSRKISQQSTISNRSIWSVSPEPVERWIAPPDFAARLALRVAPRFKLIPKDYSILDIREGVDDPIISTVPLFHVFNLLLANMAPLAGSRCEQMRYERKSIVVATHNMATPSTVHQTIYFPTPSTPLYRGSLMGEKLILESMNDAPSDTVPTTFDDSDILATALRAFGLDQNCVDFDTLNTTQSIGKIIPSPEHESLRRHLIRWLSTTYGIYSLGRNATWREKVMLDDIPQDLDRILELSSSDDYHRSLHTS